MPAPRKVSLQQLELMLNYFEKHREMAKGQQAVDKSEARAAFQSLWQELAARLNAKGMGAHKSLKGWRDRESDPPGPGPPSPPSPAEVPPRERPVSLSSASGASPAPCSPSAEAAPRAAKRRRSDASGSMAGSEDLPLPQWAWEAEQQKLKLDERRLRLEERLADAVLVISETLVSIRDEIRQLKESL